MQSPGPGAKLRRLELDWSLWLWLIVPLLCWLSYRLGEDAGRRVRPASAAPRPSSAPARLPPAAETAATIARFRAAAARYAMLEFIWDRYSEGRGLLGEEERAAAARLDALKPPPHGRRHRRRN